MKESKAIIGTLKELLKAQGITYKYLAKELHMSEASVKRIFSNQTFTLSRIEEICNVLNISILEVCEIAKNGTHNDVYEYSLEQEEFLARKPKFLAYFDLLLNGKTPKSISTKYGLSEKENFKYLKKLDELGLIELHTNNKIKFPHSKNIKWRTEGPLRKLFFKNAKFEFLNSDFSQSDELLKLSILPMSKESYSKLVSELADIYKKYERTSQIEEKLKTKTQSHGILLASRKWNFSILENISL